MRVIDNLQKNLKERVIKKGVELLDKDPQNNVDKIFMLIKKSVENEFAKARIDNVYDYYKNNEATHEFIQNILKSTDKNCLKKFFMDFFGNATWYGIPRRQKMGSKHGIKIPFSLLISPSMRCNLRCTGCYAANYDKKDDIPFEEVDRLIGEARDLGIYYIVVLGGEPFFNKYMLDIYEKYNDIYFTPFTNGTLFDEELAERLRNLGNVMPMLSLEGFEKETDARRGKGTFKKVMNSMELLKKKGVPFGVSSATSRYNVDTVTSDEFINMLIEKGSKMSWYFIYMPVGENPDINAMLTPEQRIMLGRKTRNIRASKPYFTIDFFNDAPYVGGCIAGKYYCHINSHEDIEPCIFAHFATNNVKGRPLIEGLNTEYFKELHKRQPYSDNMLRPCMMIDNTNVIREVVKKVKAYPTDKSANRMVNDKDFMEKLDKLAADFEPVANEAWGKDFGKLGNSKMSKG